MPDANALRALRCPNCGAPIEFAAGQSSVRCRFCDSVIENSAEAMTDADHAHVIPGSPESSATGASATPGQARRFVIKMRNGAPVVIESSGAPGEPPTIMDAQVQSWQSSFGTGGVTSMPMMAP